MKNIEWLKEEVNKTLHNKVADGINYYDYLDLRKSLYELINQLDEPEVVTEEVLLNLLKSNQLFMELLEVLKKLWRL